MENQLIKPKKTIFFWIDFIIVIISFSFIVYLLLNPKFTFIYFLDMVLLSGLFINSLNYEKYYLLKGDSFAVSLFAFIKIKKIYFSDIESVVAGKRHFFDTKCAEDKPQIHHIKILYKSKGIIKKITIDIDKYELDDIKAFLEILIDNAEEVDEVLKTL